MCILVGVVYSHVDLCIYSYIIIYDLWLHTRCMMGITSGCGHLFDQRSSVKFWSIKRLRGALKQDQAIKSKFWRSKSLIAIADGSIGYIVVITP